MSRAAAASDLVVYDVVVLGLGAVGSAALWSLSQRGLRVLGLDAHGPAHDRGSSHGHTRVFRHAYFEHPDYVPLLRAATATFEAWERTAGVALLHRCGVLVRGPRDAEAVVGAKRAADLHGLDVRWLEPPALARAYPQFAEDSDMVGIFEPDAGFVRVEAAVRCALGLATAPRRHHAPVARWERLGPDHIVVHPVDGPPVHTRRLALAAGAWTAPLVPELAPWLTVTRQVQAWLTPSEPTAAAADRLPCWLVDRPGQRHLYGIPADPLRPGPPLAKVARHGSDHATTPASVDRTVHPADLAPLQADVSEQVPGLVGPVADASVCLYTSTPDGHFIVDRLPHAPEVGVVAGLSRHGFKLAPALGRALADLVCDRQTDLPVDFLGLGRFG